MAEEKMQSLDAFKMGIKPFMSGVKQTAANKLQLFKLLEKSSLKITDQTISDYELFIRIHQYIDTDTKNIIYINRIPVPPTLEIQVLWMVHALNPIQYSNDNHKAFGQLIPVQIFSEYAKNSADLRLKLMENVNPMIYKQITEKIDASSFIQKYDLKEAFLRQYKFIEKMNMIQKASNITDNQMDAAMERYYKFLYLMKQTQRKKVLVPTLDIDLIWHSHQMDAVKYQQMSKLIFPASSVIDHNDNIKEETLKQYKAETQSLWNNVFGAGDYMKQRPFKIKFEAKNKNESMNTNSRKRKLDVKEEEQRTKRRKISKENDDDYDTLKQRLNAEIESKKALAKKVAKYKQMVADLRMENSELQEQLDEATGEAGCGGCG